MNIILENTESDGSAWQAVVELQGIKYRASYVNGKISTGLVPHKVNPHRPRWHAKEVAKWAEKQVKALSAEWHKLHNELYEIA